jgi:hypothetical protein
MFLILIIYLDLFYMHFIEVFIQFIHSNRLDYQPTDQKPLKFQSINIGLADYSGRAV